MWFALWFDGGLDAEATGDLSEAEAHARLLDYYDGLETGPCGEAAFSTPEAVDPGDAQLTVSAFRRQRRGAAAKRAQACFSPGTASGGGELLAAGPKERGQPPPDLACRFDVLELQLKTGLLEAQTERKKLAEKLGRLERSFSQALAAAEENAKKVEASLSEQLWTGFEGVHRHLDDESPSTSSHSVGPGGRPGSSRDALPPTDNGGESALSWDSETADVLEGGIDKLSEGDISDDTMALLDDRQFSRRGRGGLARR